MSYFLTLYDADGASELQHKQAEERFRKALEEALGDESLVGPVYTAYLRIVGSCYGFFGLGLALFFASQGAGRLAWPLAASALRLVIVALGGWLVVHVLGGPPAALYAVIAASLMALGLTLAAATHLSKW